MKVGRQWRFHRDDIERLLRGEGARLVLPADLRPLLDALAGLPRREGRTSPARAPTSRARGEPHRVPRRGPRGATSMSQPCPATARGVSPLPHRRRAPRGRALRPGLLPLIVERWKSIAGCDVRETGAPRTAARSCSAADEGGEPQRGSTCASRSSPPPPASRSPCASSTPPSSSTSRESTLAP